MIDSHDNFNGFGARPNITAHIPEPLSPCSGQDVQSAIECHTSNTSPALQRLPGEDCDEQSFTSAARHSLSGSTPCTPRTLAAGASNAVEVSSEITGAAAPSAPNLFTEAELQEAHAKASLCQEFLKLQAEKHLSGNQAAKILDRPASWFSANVPKFLAGGWQALLPQRRACGRKAEFTVPTWFIPAAKFFYLLTNRNRFAGSAPEAIRRTISLPNFPTGWDGKIKNRFLKAIGHEEAPICPPELRDAILARERDGKTMLPERLMKLIACSAATVKQYRNATDASLDFLNASGTMMWRRDGSGEKQFIRAGEVIECDDGTINFPVCIPWTIGGDPCSDKFGVKVGRFQWLRAIDAGSRFRPGFVYVIRPRGSYRAEDILTLFRAVVRAHGVPKQWRLEQGSWKANRVQDAIKLMRSTAQTVYSPHQKPFIEGGFNQDWTKLSAHFPNCDVGRFMGETEEANNILTACKSGRHDPRKTFPMLADAIAAFTSITHEQNRTPVHSNQYGTWIPEERWAAHLATSPMLRLDAETDWIFSPYVREWTVKGMLVGGRIPLFEDFSVPMDFSAPWLPQYDGARVKAYFDPTEARCAATLVLAQPFRNQPEGTVLGLASQINEVGAYARLVLGFGDDPDTGRKARQQAASALRREVRAIMPRGSRGDASTEIRDGIATKIVHEISTSPEAGQPETTSQECGSRVVRNEPLITTSTRDVGGDNLGAGSLSDRKREVENFEKDNAELFI